MSRAELIERIERRVAVMEEIFGPMRWSSLERIRMEENAILLRECKEALAVPGWVPVSERVPEDGEIVLVYSRTERPFTTDAEFKGGRFWLWTDEQNEHLTRARSVTHWMPLPTAPAPTEE